MVEIDINCDVGEGVGNESVLLPLVSSCNIACGGHAGNTKTMRQVVMLARTNGVHIGAHPSYPDRNNFGRSSMQMSDTAMKTSIRQQISELRTVLEQENATLHHIKAHGALYNDIAKDSTLASTFLEAISEYQPITFLYVPYGSVIAELAQNKGFRIKLEAFADRNYNDDFSLVSRSSSDAVISDPRAVLTHLVGMVNGRLRTVTGTARPISADTFCVHGDTENALEIMTYLSHQLPEHHIQIKK